MPLQELGGPATTAQVHPAVLTRCLMDAAAAKGAQLLIGKVQRVLLEGCSSSASTSGAVTDAVTEGCGAGAGVLGSGEVSGRQDVATSGTGAVGAVGGVEGGGEVSGAPQRVVRVVLSDGRELDADVVVVAMGPWSSRLQLELLPAVSTATAATAAPDAQRVAMDTTEGSSNAAQPTTEHASAANAAGLQADATTQDEIEKQQGVYAQASGIAPGTTIGPVASTPVASSFEQGGNQGQQTKSSQGSVGGGSVPQHTNVQRTLLPVITGQKAHSILLRPGAEVAMTDHMLFTNFKYASGGWHCWGVVLLQQLT